MGGNIDDACGLFWRPTDFIPQTSTWYITCDVWAAASMKHAYRLGGHLTSSHRQQRGISRDVWAAASMMHADRLGGHWGVGGVIFIK